MFTTVIFASILLAAASEKSPSQSAKSQPTNNAATPPVKKEVKSPQKNIATPPGKKGAKSPKEPRKQVTINDLFNVREYCYTGGQYKNQVFKYRLFEPRSIKKNERYPLLVWLHGGGEAGSDNQRSLKYLELVLRHLRHVERYQFYILVVQCPPDNPRWFRSYATEPDVGAPDEMLTVLFQILKKTMQVDSIDQDLVYLMGVSAGGSGCLEMAMRYPDMFAAIVTMGAGGGDTSRAVKLANIPIWMFHNESDRRVPPSRDQKIASELEQANGKIHLTLYRSKAHDCWRRALWGGHVMDWMLLQRRGGVCWTPPDCQPWEWRHILTVPCLFLVCVRLGWYFKRRSVKRNVEVKLPNPSA